MKIILAFQVVTIIVLLALADCSSAIKSKGITQTPSPNVTASQPPFDQNELNKTGIREQLKFSADDTVKDPVVIPEDVLSVLRGDRRIQSCLREQQTPENIPASWFVGSAFNLNRDDRPDLFVTAANPCLFGANVNPFWIFTSTPQGHKLVLAVSALAIEMLDESTNGSRDIRTDSATAREVLTTIYRFNGKEYRVSRSSRSQI